MTGYIPAGDHGDARQRDPSLEPVHIAEVIQAFREHPELFIAADLPDPPEAA
jgi:hypothetical protein